ncbi:hypothetical protein CEXT_609771 [Caerostris extrusa]|uniref:Uncharacterized protein n=1 Tax=Caerostris extrusa TaxID=172846 RepID=A0AAV4RGY4_CAEEX|nr:hypothetical protein CEXT_609771 [Caerostris extrusa]
MEMEKNLQTREDGNGGWSDLDSPLDFPKLGEGNETGVGGQGFHENSISHSTSPAEDVNPHEDPGLPYRRSGEHGSIVVRM